MELTAAESNGAHDQADAGLNFAHGHRNGEVIPCLNARPLEERNPRGTVRPLLFVGKCFCPPCLPRASIRPGVL